MLELTVRNNQHTPIELYAQAHLGKLGGGHRLLISQRPHCPWEQDMSNGQLGYWSA
ncbi:MAG: hypothetical protein AAGD96_24835 [Chloroflexota bacterium]